MRYLGLDLGTSTLGVAVSDRTNTIASPMRTLKFPREEYESVLTELKSIVVEKQITDFVLGYPKNLNNSEGYAALRSENFAQLLKNEFDLPIHYVDERLSTVEAEKILLSTDTSRQKRKKEIDSIAATLILETFLKRKEEER